MFPAEKNKSFQKHVAAVSKNHNEYLDESMNN